MILQGHSGPLPRGRGGPSGHGAGMLARLIAEGRLRPDIAITCRGRIDGAGQQAIAVISAMMLARYAGCGYLHSPFARMAHAEGTPEDWAARWERFFNFGDGETLAPDNAQLVPLSAVIADPEAYAGRPIVIFQPLFGLPDEAARVGDALRSDLRARYWRSPKTAIPSHRAPVGGLTAAIHVRRGDVNATLNTHRYVSDEMVLRHIARLQRAVAPFGRPLTLNLYSEGNVEDFRTFAEAGCNLHVSEDPFETLHNMVTTDILVSAPSNFSYVAAFLSRGIVLDHRGRVPRFSNWLRRRKNGDIPIKRLQHALLRRIGWLERCAFHVRSLGLRMSPAAGRRQ